MEDAFFSFQAQHLDGSSSDASLDLTAVVPGAVGLATASSPESLVAVAPPTPDGAEEGFLDVGLCRNSSDEDAPLTPSYSEDDLPLSRMQLPPTRTHRCITPFISMEDMQASISTSSTSAPARQLSSKASSSTCNPLRAVGKAWDKNVALRHGDKLDFGGIDSDVDSDDGNRMHPNTWLAEGVLREVWCQVGRASTRRRPDIASSRRPLDMTDALKSSIDEAGLRMENVSF